LKRNQSFLSDVNNKINEFEENNCNASEETIKFVIKYNQLEKQTIKDGFNAYFVNNTIPEDLNIIINFLNSEVYYEKV